jgi:acetyl-CoA carboxylase biotin carboxyl carrier protein
MARSVKSEIAGVVDALAKAVGDPVQDGDEVIILSSMKMEIPVLAPIAGTIQSFAVSKGDTIAENQILFIIET